ncbi:MAG TPA: type IX secretion system membrane protein PorP/SprF [Flavobacteriales bacterium]|nr:type IX secretion system membrane protein PorP/SprF [Flavobacteriales bacterium]
MKKIILAAAYIVLSGIINLGNAQDIHLSQFYQTPLLVNPALTGMFNGDHRVFINYKDQWGSIGEPYKTSLLSYDLMVGKKKRKTSYLGLGLSVFNDKAGEFEMGITQVNLSVSGIVIINGNQVLSAGMQGGFAQRSINTENLRWGNQFNGKNYNPAINSGESFEPSSYGDISAGLSWSYGVKKTNMSSNDQFKVNAGIALLHINKPKQSFYADGNETLYSKLVVHGGSYIGIKRTSMALVPGALILLQGPTREVNVGAMLRYTLKEESKYTGLLKETAVYFGGYYRVGDAFIPSFMFEMANFTLGLSYDVNISSLKTASNGQGGLELSFRYMSPNPFRSGKGTKYTPML